MKLRFIQIILIGIFSAAVMSGCRKEKEKEEAIEHGTVKDVDGNVYQTVKIGNQWWMAEDLRVTKYRDSSFISLVAGPPADTTWKHLTHGAYCNNVDVGAHLIGRFYNYYAVSDPRGIAPAGWHIPTDAEWKQLEQHLGMSAASADGTGWRGTHEAEKLKVVRGTVNGWADYGTVWPTNESGFSALAGGCRMFDGSWANPGQSSTGFWWTLTEAQNSDMAWYRYLDYKNANVFRYYGLKTYGFSIRCVKD